MVILHFPQLIRKTTKQEVGRFNDAPPGGDPLRDEEIEKGGSEFNPLLRRNGNGDEEVPRAKIE
ncbi:hypothetical protein U1Q18_023317, partial [Sarracenia purpurea var. burkii]